MSLCLHSPPAIRSKTISSLFTVRALSRLPFPSQYSPGLFDYIAFIAMIILKDHSTLTGIFFPATNRHTARFFLIRLAGPEYAVFNCIVDVTPSGVMPKAKPDTTWLPYRVHFPPSPRCVFVHRHVRCQAVASQTATASASSATPPLQVFFSGMFCCVLCLIQRQEALRTAVHSTQKWSVACRAHRPLSLTFTQDEGNYCENTMIKFQFGFPNFRRSALKPGTRSY